MNERNRLANCHNPFQGQHKKVLCVCSAGLLRSPTAAVVLSQEPFNFNTRAAGVSLEFALVPVDGVLLDWADQIVCLDIQHHHELIRLFPDEMEDKEVIVLGIPDNFEYRDPILMRLIKKQYEDISIMRKAHEE